MVRNQDGNLKVEVSEKLLTESVFPEVKTPEDIGKTAELLKKEKATGTFVIRLNQGGVRRVHFQEEEDVDVS